MEKARVVLFEDDEDILELIKRRLVRGGHSVSSTASSMDEARRLIAELKDADFEVAVVDGNLGTGKSDGPEIASLLHGRFNDLVVIGNSSDGEVSGADYNADKGSSQTLLDIIEAL